MKHVQFTHRRSGKVQAMSERYARILESLGRGTYLTRDIPEAPIFKLTQPQPELPQLDLGSHEKSAAAEHHVDPADAPRPRGRRRATTSANQEELAAPAEEPQE